MLVGKVINNNIVRSVDEENREVLVMGSGIGFKKSVGEVIVQEKVEKIYILNDDINRLRFEELLSQIPIEVIKITNEIIDYGKVSLAKDLPDSLYTVLLDHINFAIERTKEGLVIRNALIWETKRFYANEFSIGEFALELIDQKLGVNLPEDEAAFIALHFASANIDAVTTEEAKKILSTIKDILTIVRYHFNIELNESTIHYERFVTHLKFFIQRMLSGRHLDEDDDDFLMMLKTKYKAEYLCTLKISDYFQNNYQLTLTTDEIMYLTIHIRRITAQ
ncbi:MAG: PRD domain-containing protein [Lactococcus plantarum]|nr:PRD domain-containing protein [Lactococcus plantarum]